MTRTVQTADLGMDLLLGGGWRVVDRFRHRASATVVVRGGPGAGKTLVALQVALDLATAMQGDVLVACVELLPTEYVAQIRSARPDIGENRVSVLPASLSDSPQPRVFLGLLAEVDFDSPDLVAGLESLGQEARNVGGKPVAVIVDSLIEGYGLGGSMARTSVDAVMKFAASRGYGIVLCEEASNPLPSPWVFAADTVLEVGVESKEQGRWVEIRKHRLGASVSGRHELHLSGVRPPEVFPEPHAWIHPSRRQVLTAHGWDFLYSDGFSDLMLHRALRSNPNANERFEGGLVLVTGPESGLARTLALVLLPVRTETHRDLIIEFDPLALDEEYATSEHVDIWYLPTAGGPARALRRLVEQFTRLLQQSPSGLGRRPRRIVMGDLGNVLTETGLEWVEALRAFASLLIESGRGISLIAYEGRGHVGKSAAHAVLAKYADLTIEIEWGCRARQRR